MKRKQISKIGVDSVKLNSGIGYIIIPDGVDRDQFLLTCFRTGKVSILTESAERLDNVSVVQSSFNNLVFPATPKELGSVIFWVKIPKHNIPVVVGCLNKTNDLLPIEEGEFYVGRRGKEHKISIIGQEHYGDLFITLDSLSSKKSSKFEINLSSKIKQSLFQIICDGDVVVNTNNINLQAASKFELIVKEAKNDKFLRLKYTLGEGFDYLDEFNNIIQINKDQIYLEKGDGKKITVTNKIKLGNGSFEPSVLGDKNSQYLSDILDKLITLLNNLSTFSITQAGASIAPPLTPLSGGFTSLSTQIITLLTEVNVLKGQVNTLKSQVNFLE